MKIIKKKIIYCASTLIAGIILIIAANLKNNDSMMLGLGTGLAVVALLKLIQFIRLARDPEKMKKYEIMQNEERLILIVTRSGYTTFMLSILAEYIAIVVLIIMEKEQIASIVCAVTGLQVLCYLIMYFLYNRKY